MTHSCWILACSPRLQQSKIFCGAARLKSVSTFQSSNRKCHPKAVYDLRCYTFVPFDADNFVILSLL